MTDNEKKTLRGSIYLTERDRYGWTIRGCIGMRRYIGYSKKEVIAKYRTEVLASKVCFGNKVIYLDPKA